MNKPKPSFIKNLKPTNLEGPWRVSLFHWEVAPDGPVHGHVVEAVEASDLELARLAARRLLDTAIPQGTKLITLEIATSRLIDGGQI